MAGALVDPKATPPTKPKAPQAAVGFYGKWLPQPRHGPGRSLAPTRRWERPLAGQLALRRTCEPQAGPLHVLRHVAVAGALEKKQGFLGRLVDIGAELFAMSAAASGPRCSSTTTGPRAPGLAVGPEGKVRSNWPTCSAAALAGEWTASSPSCGTTTTTDNYRAAQKVLAGDYTWAEAGIIDPSLMSVLVPGSEAASEDDH